MSGWDDPHTPIYYEAFCREHSRYQRANAILISHARIEPGLRVLDLAAGTGRTAEAALKRLGDQGRLACVEPSGPMRAEGMRRVRDSRVEWYSTLREAQGPFDRILCGAAIWQMAAVSEMFRDLAGLLCRGGALCFNIPALYLLEPDEPGGGADPLLLALPAFLATSNDGAEGEQPSLPSEHHLSSAAIEAGLLTAGLRAHSWTFGVRLTQDAYASWLKIPVVTGRMLAGVPADERALRIDAALESVDRSSWKRERWRGWTAWKQ